jgi:IrrE N-terminal-like domain
MSRVNWEPEDYAKALLRRLSLERITDLYLFAESIGLEVKEVDSDAFDGALVRRPGELKGIIAVRRGIREVSRKLFTVAHEIAHFLLPGHGVSDLHCTSADINSWAGNVAREKEAAANKFAAELLLPSKLLYPIVNQRKATIALAQELAGEFGTSLTATALRCVELTEEPCALVCSESGEIKWSRKNSQFGKYIPKSRLGVDSLAGELFINRSARSLSGEISTDVWTQSDDDKNTVIWEDSILLDYYDSVLTILTFS